MHGFRELVQVCKRKKEQTVHEREEHDRVRDRFHAEDSGADEQRKGDDLTDQLRRSWFPRHRRAVQEKNRINCDRHAQVEENRHRFKQNQFDILLHDNFSQLSGCLNAHGFKVLRDQLCGFHRHLRMQRGLKDFLRVFHGHFFFIDCL